MKIDRRKLRRLILKEFKEINESPSLIGKTADNVRALFGKGEEKKVKDGMSLSSLIPLFSQAYSKIEFLYQKHNELALRVKKLEKSSGKSVDLDADSELEKKIIKKVLNRLNSEK